MRRRQLKRLHTSKRIELDRARRSYQQRAWADAFQALVLADEQTALEPEDLERLAIAAYLIGRDDDYVRTLERAYNAHVDAGQSARAVRCAFWLGFRLRMRGETARATGWESRAERLLGREASECAERGYLLLTTVDQHLEVGSFEQAYAAAADAAMIGERCCDADLIAWARHLQGRARLQQGQVDAGLALLD
jgi:hypothetical protein